MEFDTKGREERQRFQTAIVHFVRSGEIDGIPKSMQELCLLGRSMYQKQGTCFKASLVLDQCLLYSEEMKNVTSQKRYLLLRKIEANLSTELVILATPYRGRNIVLLIKKLCRVGIMIDTFADIKGDWERNEISFYPSFIFRLKVSCVFIKDGIGTLFNIGMKPKIWKFLFLATIVTLMDNVNKK